MITLARLRLVVVALFLVMMPIPTAWAHAQLLRTEPSENAVLDVAPSEVALTFNEPVSPLTLELIGPDGSSTKVDATAGSTVIVRPPAELARGTYVLSYRVVSSDGHPIGGALMFSIGDATGAQSTPAAEPAAAIALWAGKAILFIAMCGGIGGAMFLAVGELPRGARVVATSLSAAGVVAALATLALQGVDALGLPLARIVDGAVWRVAFSTSYGFTAIAASVALLAALAALRMPPGRDASVLGMTAGALAALSQALSGHASAASPQWFTRPAVFVHICGVLFWVGSLFPLGLLLRNPSWAADRALERFSRAIPFAVVPLALSGFALATIQMGPPGPQWLTAYGFVLAAKLVLLAALFGLALWNRIYLTGPSVAGDASARRLLRWSIGLETAVVVIILVLAAAWRFTPPPRALTAAAPVNVATPLMLHAMDATTMATVTVTPGQAGPVGIDIAITTVEGAPVDAQSVAVTLSLPALGIEAIKRAAAETEGGWHVTDWTIPVAGTWQLGIEVRLNRFEDVRLQTELNVP